AMRLNCFHQTVDIRGTKLTSPNAAIHHHTGDISGRMRRSTTTLTAIAPATFNTVISCPEPWRPSTLLITAKTAARNGIPVHDPRVSGWPVTQAVCPANHAAPVSYADGSWNARKLHAATIAAKTK